MSWSTPGSRRKNTSSHANKVTSDGRLSLPQPPNVKQAAEDQVCPTPFVRTSGYRVKRTSYHSLRALQTNPGQGATLRAKHLCGLVGGFVACPAQACQRVQLLSRAPCPLLLADRTDSPSLNLHLPPLNRQHQDVRPPSRSPAAAGTQVRQHGMGGVP